jgi:hypothetical protein
MLVEMVATMMEEEEEEEEEDGKGLMSLTR